MTLKLLWKYKNWIAIAVFFVLYLVQIAYTNHLIDRPVYNNVCLDTEACNSSTHLSPTVPSNLMQPTAKLHKLETGEGKSILPWAVDTVAKYNQCSAQVDAFIELNKPSK